MIASLSVYWNKNKMYNSFLVLFLRSLLPQPPLSILSISVFQNVHVHSLCSSSLSPSLSTRAPTHTPWTLGECRKRSRQLGPDWNSSLILPPPLPPSLSILCLIKRTVSRLNKRLSRRSASHSVARGVAKPRDQPAVERMNLNEENQWERERKKNTKQPGSFHAAERNCIPQTHI